MKTYDELIGEFCKKSDEIKSLKRLGARFDHPAVQEIRQEMNKLQREMQDKFPEKHINV